MGGMNLGSGFAAGAGADELQDVLKNLFERANANKIRQQEQQRIGIEQQRADDEKAYRTLAVQNAAQDKADRQQAALVGEGERIGGSLAPGADVTGQTNVIRALTAAGLGPQHQGATLASTAMQGGAMAGGGAKGAAAPTVGPMATTANAGHGEQDIYQGTAAQQQGAAQLKAVRMLAAKDPNSPLARWVAVTGGKGTPPAELFKDGEQTTEAQMDAQYQKILQKKMGGAPLSPDETSTMQAYERRKTLVPSTNFTLNQPKVADARTDRSYKMASDALDKLRSPVATTAQKASELDDLLNQNTPQADSLVAPKLLSVLVGGQGSGLRMTQPELERVSGGAGKWQALLGTLQQWNTDPTKASPITPEQRKQIRALVDSVKQHTSAKLKVLDDADNSLLDATDVQTHRQIVHSAKQALDTATTGTAAPATSSAPALVWDGTKFVKPAGGG